MDIHHLVKMANDIGAFFASDPDPGNGAKAIANHLKRFWDPRMRRELFSYLDRDSGTGLSSLVLEALRSHRNEIDPTRYSASS
jgi:formate dehydrogenase subunit delta